MLWLIGSLSRVFRVPFDPQLISQQFPPPYSRTALLNALQALGFSVGGMEMNEGGIATLERIPFPVIAFLREDEAEADADAPDVGRAMPDMVGVAHPSAIPAKLAGEADVSPPRPADIEQGISRLPPLPRAGEGWGEGGTAHRPNRQPPCCSSRPMPGACCFFAPEPSKRKPWRWPNLFNTSAPTSCWSGATPRRRPPISKRSNPQQPRSLTHPTAPRSASLGLFRN